MRLKPDDILQEGDLIHWNDGSAPWPVKESIGQPVSILNASEESWVAYAERPGLSDAEKIKMLREALEDINEFGSMFQGVAIDNICNIARAALDATKE